MANIKSFILVNISATLLGYLYYLLFLYNNIYLLVIFAFIKNSVLLHIIHSNLKRYQHLRPTYTNNTIVKNIDMAGNGTEPKFSEYTQKSLLMCIYNCGMYSFIEIVDIFLCKKRNYEYILLEWLYFIPISFIFEIIFDLFFYITHRLLHTKYLYTYVHHTHHMEHDQVTVLTTFHVSSMETLITSSIPMYLTSILIPFSYPQYFTFLFYKTFMEIAGHIGKIEKGGNFYQCVWIPIFLNIELRSIDHYNHHIKYNCNFSKRFSLWDKFFCTYYKPSSSTDIISR